MLYIIIAIIALGVITLALMALLLIRMKKAEKKPRKKTEYKSFFVMGICFIPLGIIFSTTINPTFIFFTAIGVIYMALGLSHRDEWKK